MNATRKLKLLEKRRRSESESEQGEESGWYSDVKRVDLSLARMKLG